MKKLGVILLAIIAVAAVAGGGFWLISRGNTPANDQIEKFALSEEMYGQGGFQDITTEEFGQLVTEQKSFIVVAHMVVCPAEFPVTSIAKQLAREDDLVIYGLTEEEFKQTDLAKSIKYLPSVAVYRDGTLVAYLDAAADEDTEYYKTVDGLKRWLGRYLIQY